MASFDIKSELNLHELTNAVDQANRVLQNRFDFKGTNASFALNAKEILLTAKEDFQIKQMEPVLHEAMSKRGIDLKTLQPGSIESATGEARQSVSLQEGIGRELAKKITTLLKQSKIKVQASIQGESIRINGKKRDELQQTIQLINCLLYTSPSPRDP